MLSNNLEGIQRIERYCYKKYPLSYIYLIYVKMFLSTYIYKNGK